MIPFLKNKKTLIIAEIGTAHGGSLEKAKTLVDAAYSAGADCVKFQIVYAEEILHPDTGFVKLPTGTIALYRKFRELEVKAHFFKTIKEYCDKKNILFSCSPFGSRSLEELLQLDPYAIKIASPELNHIPLLQQLNQWYLEHPESLMPVILSSGVSKLKDIELAMEQLTQVKNKALLHCITSYPAPEEEYNLNILEPLSVIFNCPVGISDHSLHPILVPVLSVACGGSIIEKHICASKTDKGLDDPVALPPEDFAAMVKTVRLAELLPKKDVLKMAEEEFGQEKVMAVLGTGQKILAPSEEANYKRTNRSIHFMRSMTAGEKITAKDISILRTEKILSPGISPKFYDQILGAKLATDAKDGEGLTWKHVIMKN